MNLYDSRGPIIAGNYGSLGKNIKAYRNRFFYCRSSRLIGLPKWFFKFSFKFIVAYRSVLPHGVPLWTVSN